MKLKGPNISGIISALASGDSHNQENARKAFDQLTMASASSLYLEKRAGDRGISQVPGLGMSDDDFRNYAITTTNNKLTLQSVLKTLEVFFGPDLTRGHLTSTMDGPYHLRANDTLQIEVDKMYSVEVHFVSSDFRIMSAATAEEVAIAITKAFRLQALEAYALAVENPITGGAQVKIYSSAIGLGASIQIVGGRAQNVLQFPQPIPIVVTPGDVWSVDITEVDRAVYTVVSHAETDLMLLEEGDIANIYGTGFGADNRGSFVVTNVDIVDVGGVLEQSFEVVNPSASAMADVDVFTSQDLFFFRPQIGSPQASGIRGVLAAATKPEIVNAIYPATTRVVGRRPGLASYLLDNEPVEISSDSMVKLLDGVVTVSTGAPHNLMAGQTIQIQNSVPSIQLPPITPGTVISPQVATTDITPAAHWHTINDISWVVESYGHTYIELEDGSILRMGGTSMGSDSDTNMRLTVTPTDPPVIEYGQLQYVLQWGFREALPVSTRGHAVVRLRLGPNKGKVLVLGGTAGLAMNHLYDPDTNLWEPSGIMNFNGAARCETLSVQNLLPHVPWLHLFIGADDASIQRSQALFEGGGSMVNLPAELDYRGYGHRLARIDGGIMIIGGREVEPITGIFLNPYDRVDTYDGNSVTVAASRLTYARYDFGVTTLPNGDVMVVGGKGRNLRNETTNRALDEVELYDKTLGFWRPCGRLAEARIDPVVSYLAATNTVMVAGGEDVAGNLIGTVEFYDVATGRWTRGHENLELYCSTRSPYIEFGDGFILAQTGLDGIVERREVNLFLPGAIERSVGKLNTESKVSNVIDATTFTLEPEDNPLSLNKYSDYRGGQIIPLQAQMHGGDWVGPILVDTKKGLGLTSTETLSTQDIDKGTQRTSLTVDDASTFPDEEGWLVLGFGHEYSTYPVRYLGRMSPTELRLDYRFKFPHSVPTGSTVTLLSQKGIWTPDAPEDLGLTYLTDSALGRRAAQQTLESILAAGIELQSTVVYPGDAGLGNEGWPEDGPKVSDKLYIWGEGDDY
jgi:hypothetical protein